MGRRSTFSISALIRHVDYFRISRHSGVIHFKA
jgi:hypothetical protein